MKEKTVLNISKLTCTNIDGSTFDVDFGKELANIIFQKTQDIAEHDLAMRIFKSGEISKDDIEMVKPYVEQYFFAYVQVAFNKLINE